MSEEKEKLSIEEQEVMSKACYMMLTKCPHIPKGVKTAFSNIDKATIGMFSESGAVVERRYIGGSFIAQYPFTLLYRTKPNSDAERIKCEETLNKIAKYLCVLTEFPPITDGREIKSIDQSSTVSVAGRLEDGSIDYRVSIILKYKKKGKY